VTGGLDLTFGRSTSTFRVVSNFTEVASFSTLAAAKAFAVEESYRFDDAVTIEKNALPSYYARGGRLYRLVAL